jgi:hypothetical protein
MSIQPRRTGTGLLARLAQDSLGPDTLQKVVIEHETRISGTYGPIGLNTGGSPRPGRIEALFNPNQLSYSKQVSWEIKPIVGDKAGTHWLGFQASQPETLTLDLFLDTYEGEPTTQQNSFAASVRRRAAGLIPDNPLASLFESRSAVDVSQRADAIAGLARVQPDLHRPPRCKLYWGNYLLIRGVLTSVSEVYSFFLPDGTPVRANMTCTFTEAVDPNEGGIETHSADLNKQRVVRLGETLNSIAREEYNDPSLWRLIAHANQIDNPRLLSPGTVLVIPPLPTGGP